MKIKRLASQIARLPVEEPLAGGPAYGRSNNLFVTVRLETEDGIEGLGVTFFGGMLSKTLKCAVEQLGELILGADPLEIDAITQRLRTAAASAGPGGILTLAISAIDMALWDIKGKYLGQPLGTMLGGLRDRVPTYASGALVRGYSLDHLLKSAPLLVEKGFKQMKTQLALPGETTPEKEVERAGRYGYALALVLFDVDRLSDINKDHGYGVGDRILERLGILIRTYFRQHDWVARLGEDAIVVLLPRTDPDNAADLAERVRATVEERLEFTDHRTERPVEVTVSAAVINLEVSVGDVIDPERLIADAEAAVERAKQKGRNRVERVDGYLADRPAPPL